MVSSAIVTTNHRKSADVIVAKKSGKPDGAKDRTVNHLEYVLIESFRLKHMPRGVPQVLSGRNSRKGKETVHGGTRNIYRTHSGQMKT